VRRRLREAAGGEKRPPARRGRSSPGGRGAGSWWSSAWYAGKLRVGEEPRRGVDAPGEVGGDPGGVDVV